MAEFMIKQTSKHRQTMRYVKTLEQMLFSLKTMCNDITPEKALLVSAMSKGARKTELEPEPTATGDYGDYFGVEETKWAMARQRTLSLTGSDLNVDKLRQVVSMESLKRVNSRTSHTSGGHDVTSVGTGGATSGGSVDVPVAASAGPPAQGEYDM